MDTQQRDEALREYYNRQDVISKYDQQLVTIKSLGTTASGAIVAAGLTTASESGLIYLAAFGACLVFWAVEAQMKSFQRVAIMHASELEDALVKNGDYAGPTIQKSYLKSGMASRIVSIFRCAAYPIVFIPYLPMAIFSLLLLFEAKSGYLTALLNAVLKMMD